MSKKTWIKTKLPEKIKEEIDKVVKTKKIKDKKQFTEKIKEEYEDMQITPGEAIGIVSAQSIGEPGTQMCVAGDEKVILKFNNNIKITKIGNFVDKVFENVKVNRHGKYEIYDIPNELLVLGLDKDEKIKWSKVSTLNRVKSPAELIKIKTKSGRSITATDFHSFVTRKHNEVVSIAGKDLKSGDRIPVIKYLPENCISSITVSDYTNDSIEKDGLLSSSKRRGAKAIPNIFELNNSFGWFIGAYLAEGHSSGGQVGISNINENYLENARKFITNIGLDYKETYSTHGFALSKTLRVSSALLSKFVILICNAGSANKKVPDFAYNAKEEFVCGLLRGYFDGDGNVSTQRKIIRASSKSKELVKGISLLLNRFGIFSRTSKDKKGSYWIYIPYGYARIFLDKIGLDIPKKKAGLVNLVKIADKRNTKSLDQIEVVSGFDDLFYNLAKKLSYSVRYVNNFTKRQKIGKATLFRYIKLFEKLGKEKKIDITKELAIMRRMFYSDVIWDKIEKIEYIKPKSEYVYDLSVPELKTFTTFDGIVTHNTMRTFHFVGVAEMSVTLGLPRIIEILDARKEPKTPTMWVYLNKQCNKSREAAEKIATKIKEVTLSHLAKEITLDLSSFNVSISLNRDELKAHEVKTKEIAELLEKQIKGIKVDTTDSKIKLILKSPDVKKLYKLKEKAKNLPVAGVKGVTNVLPVWKRDIEEFVIQTYGSNLKSVFALEEVDETRTTSNNIHEVAKVLGIEAARQTIINETIHVLEEQGMPVDDRHILLVADLMCNTGELKGITRHGVTSQKTSVLARASFEIPLKHLINASIIGETDQLASIVENIMVNQPIPVGTGLPDLVVKMKGEDALKKKKKK